MTKKAKLRIRCSAESLNAAAEIAPHFDLYVSDVGELIETLRPGAPASEGTDSAFFEDAEEWRQVISMFQGPGHSVAVFNFRRSIAGGEIALSLPLLASLLPDATLEHLRAAKKVLTAAMNIHWYAKVRDHAVEPRKPLIVAMMASAAQFWSECFDEYPDGEFVQTDEGFWPEPGTGMDFVTRVVMAAAGTVEVEDIHANVKGMQDVIGMTAYLEYSRAHVEAEAEAEHAAKRAHLRVIK
ncbi:hypothetical protein M9978_04735 [Sphingomonas sp. MG17]|uniref:Uncharacterized protein n=1 Tax=Sphingomonas tagetis TaxID=2949092 RepID=A0A9X2KJQ3_9SPHN|nr:hypothetical protein [Sphingomonas tagetis]MCP3729729.1 hypothetical protein [Sphingomonas tagetis]